MRFFIDKCFMNYSYYCLINSSLRCLILYLYPDRNDGWPCARLSIFLPEYLPGH